MSNTVDMVNDLALASFDNWGVEMHNDHLWNQTHHITIAHSPGKCRPDNKFATLGMVSELMIAEVHGEMVDQGFIPSNKEKD